MLVSKCEVFLLYCYCLIGLNFMVIAKGLIWLELSNDGPAILDSTINFYATLKGDTLKNNYTYKFQDNAVQHPKVIVVTSGVNCTYPVPVTKPLYRKGNFTMKVTVFDMEMSIFTKEIASKNTSFTLTEGINGGIVVIKEGNVEPGMYLPTSESVNFTFHIHDPNGFFNNATLMYVWEINSEIQVYDSIMQHKFAKTGQNKVSLILVAEFPQSSNQEAKWGIFNKDFIIQDRIPRINVTGDTWIQHGKMLNLHATCNGSSPFHYCWKIYPGNKPEANFTCDYPRTSFSCQFSVHYYIAVTGQYYISIFVANGVSAQRKSLNVLIFDTSHVPQLSVTIIPITCVVLAIIIIVSGIAYYLHQRKQYVIEIADFDFTQSEEMVERTFFGRIYDAVKNILKGNSVNNGRATVSYGSVTECKRNSSDTSTPCVC